MEGCACAHARARACSVPLSPADYSSTIEIGRLVKKGVEKDAPMQWNTQAGNITTNLKVKIDFTLPALSATNVVTWNFHVDDFTKVGYDMILGGNILT